MEIYYSNIRDLWKMFYIWYTIFVDVFKCYVIPSDPLLFWMFHIFYNKLLAFRFVFIWKKESNKNIHIRDLWESTDVEMNFGILGVVQKEKKLFLLSGYNQHFSKTISPKDLKSCTLENLHQQIAQSLSF